MRVSNRCVFAGPLLSAVSALASVLLAGGAAHAQSFTVQLPGSAASPTAAIPNSACSPTTTRTYAAWQFNVATTGTYTFSITKAGGSPGGLTATIYQGIFLPSSTCVNQWTPTVSSGGTTLTTNQLLSPAGVFFLVIGGANASDTSNLTVTATGPGTLTSVCTDSTLTPASQMVTNAGGMFTTTYSPAVGCGAWTTSGVPAWITGIPASGTGSRAINYTVASNPGAARNASITIGGQSLSVRQSASCATTLSPTSTSVAAAGGGGSFMLTGTSGCAYTASTTTPWIRNVAPASGTGSATITFMVDANTGPARTGTITAGGQTFTVNQASGCTFTVTPALLTPTAAGGSQMVRVETAAGCTWSTMSTASWITGLPASGTGPSNVNFSVAANTGPSRNDTITIGGRTVSVVQADGCAPRLDPASRGVPATAGMSSVMVNVGAGCAWSMSSTAGWLVSTAMNGTGPRSVDYTYSANTGAARSASLVVGGSIHTVNQTAAGVTDSGVIVDSGVVTDSGVATDSGVVTDSGVTTDSGIATDSGVESDTGIAEDASPMPDAVDTDATPTDTGVAEDVTSNDVVNSTDSATRPDSATTDASVDGGSMRPSGSGCGCRTPATPGPNNAAPLVVIALGALFVRRRRAKRAA